MAKISRTEKIRADLQGARDAVETIERELRPRLSSPSAPAIPANAEAVAAAAKTLEAFGCYVRRTKIGD